MASNRQVNIFPRLAPHLRERYPLSSSVGGPGPYVIHLIWLNKKRQRTEGEVTNTLHQLDIDSCAEQMKHKYSIQPGGITYVPNAFINSTLSRELKHLKSNKM